MNCVTVSAQIPCLDRSSLLGHLMKNRDAILTAKPELAGRRPILPLHELHVNLGSEHADGAGMPQKDRYDRFVETVETVI